MNRQRQGFMPAATDQWSGERREVVLLADFGAVESPAVLPLGLCSPDRSEQVGGKTKGLYKLIELGLPVPEGFAITANAYRATLAATGVGAQIDDVLAQAELSDDAKSQAIFALFENVTLPADLSAEIDNSYDELGGGPVAVRSSGIAEDTAAASFAGQHDTYLWIQGADAVRHHVLRCWASLFNPSAIGYRERFRIPADEVAMGVVVQRMVPAAAGGVMMTLEPVTGESNLVYIEAAHGLGEGVVVGDVLSDQYRFDKANLDNPKKRISRQTEQHRFDPDAGAVTLQPMDPEVGSQPALDDDLARALAQLGLDIERSFGAPMDIEWAVSEEREIFLLQARPETVWSTRWTELATTARTSVTHGDLNQDWYYSTANLGEAAPGVLAPLSWSVWGPGAEIAARYGFVQMGVLEASKAGIPDDPHARFIQIAYGRAVASVSAFYDMGERIPGASGNMIAESLLGSIPSGMIANPTRRRYPVVMWRMPKAFVRSKAVIDKQHRTIREWWLRELERTQDLDLAGARAQFTDAVNRFQKSTALQAQGNIIAVPPVFQALEQLVASVDMEEYYGVLTSGGDHAEIAVVTDLWDLGRGRLTESEFLRRHGFHGTLEGDIAGRVWREDPSPIRHIAQMYKTQGDDKDPRAMAEARNAEKERAESELMSRLGWFGRLKARLILRLARRHMPLRGVGKASFLRSLDVARSSARRIGELLVAEGILDAVDDVMYLTSDELIAPAVPENVRELVAARKTEQELFRSFELPVAFWGEPGLTAPAPETVDGDAAGDRITGIGASAGVVEGVVRVVDAPGFAEVEPGEILVAKTTDPSWASIMFVSSALVVDIGGTLSHAAVVARELRLPCVVNTGDGTSVLRTGDRVRVDGRSGVVEILERATRTS